MTGTKLNVMNSKKNPTRLSEVEDKYKVIFNSSEDGLLLVDPKNLAIKESNLKFNELFEYTSEELEKKVLFSIIPDTKKQLINYISSLQQERKSEGNPHKEYLCEGKNKQKFWFEVGFQLVSLNDFEYALITFKNISEQKKIATILKNCTNELDVIFNNTPIIMVVINSNSQIDNINLTGINFFKQKKEDLLGLRFGNLINCINSKQDRDCGKNPDCTECDANQLIKETFINKKNTEKQDIELECLINNNSTKKYFEISAYYIKILGEEKVLLNLDDITDIKTSEKALQQSELKAKTFLDNTSDIVIFTTPNGIIIDCNAASLRILKKRREDFVGKKLFSLFPVQKANVRKKLFEEAIKTKKPRSMNDQKDNYYFYTTIQPIADHEGNINLVSVHAHNITDLTKTQNALYESEEQYRAIFDSLQDVYYRTDKNGIITLISPSVLKHSGFSPKEITGHHFSEFYPNPKTSQLFLKKLRENGSVSDFEQQLEVKSGSILDVSINSHIILDEKNKPIGMEGMIRDVSQRKKMEKELIHSQKQLDLALHSANLGLWDYNIETEEIIINDIVLKMLGYNKNKQYLIPDEWQELIHPSDVESKNTLFNSHLEGKSKTYRAEYRVKTKSGQYKWILDIGSVVERDEKGNPLRIIGIHMDIDNRIHMKRELEEARSWLQTIVNNVNVAVFAKNKKGQYLMANDHFKEELGIEPEEILGKTDSELFSKEDSQKVKATDNYVIKKKQPIQYEESYTNPNGSKNTYFITKAPLLDENKNVNAIVGSATNISEVKLMSEQLKYAKEEAELANRAKSDFLANMSHEIRTPLNAIVGFSHLALQTKLNSKQERFIKNVHTSSQNLRTIIDDILDFSKIEARKMELESVIFRIEDVITKISDIVGIDINRKKLDFLFHIDPHIPSILKGDPIRLGQVLLNLVNNSVKFTEKGEIVISIDLINNNKNKVNLKFSVSDTGLGIKAKQKKSLFDEFSQADSSTTRKFGGTGLGLAISRRLVDLMGGSLYCESEYGIGSTFSFSLDLDCKSSDDDTQYCKLKEFSQSKIIFSDRNKNSRIFWKKTFESNLFNTETTSSLNQGIEILENNSNNSINNFFILRYTPRDKNLTGIINKIRSNPNISKALKIIVITNSQTDKTISIPTRNEIDEILIAPIIPHAFLKVLSNFLKGKLKNHFRYSEDIQETQSFDYDFKGSRILLVEDNELNQEVAKEILKSVGSEVVIANHGKEAIQLVKSQKFDAVFMDLQMPIMDGITATQNIRKDSQFKNLPIIAMTADVVEGIKEKVVKAGMNDYISKPLNLDYLFQIMSKWIIKKKETEQNIPYHKMLKLSNKKEFPDLPGFDVKKALKRINDNTKLYKKLLLTFKNRHQDIGEVLGNAMIKKDDLLSFRLITTIKENSSNLGANLLYESINMLESSIKKKRTQKIQADFENFKVELNRITKAISQLETESSS